VSRPGSFLESRSEAQDVLRLPTFRTGLLPIEVLCGWASEIALWL